MQSFVEAHDVELSNLSKREALKHIAGSKKRKANTDSDSASLLVHPISRRRVHLARGCQISLG